MRLSIQLYLALSVLASVIGGGCRATLETARRATISVYEPSNYRSSGPLSDELVRVAMLPLYHHQQEGAFLDDLERTFYTELNKTLHFEVVPISRDDLERLFKRRHFASFEALPADILQGVRNHFGADVVCFTDITQYEPYQPMAIGIRSKLVNLRNGEIIWAFDSLFDTGNPHVAVAARRYQHAHLNQAYPLDVSDSILLSPGRFGKYVAHAVYGTLPER